jgi:Na+/H+ antiporter NhaA
VPRPSAGRLRSVSLRATARREREPRLRTVRAAIDWAPSRGGTQLAAENRRPEFGGRTAWGRSLAAPVREFLATETGGAAVMAAGTVVALVWANAALESYDSTWSTVLSIHIGGSGIAMDLRAWVNEGLMTLFFLVVGLQAKRELDLGELRERRRLVIPASAAAGGIVMAIAIFVAFNAGGAGAGGWGAAMSTDTAFAMGILALLAPPAATRIRIFLLTLAVFDDLAGLVVIAAVYTRHLDVAALAAAGGLFLVLLSLRYLPAGRAAASAVTAVALWYATYRSGIDPVVSGLAIGLVTGAYPPAREDLERASAVARSFREEPTPELARSVQRSVTSAISANERLQYGLHPWVSYAVLPVFALANAGLHITGPLLSAAIGSPVFLGIAVGYLVGKPTGIIAGSWLATRPSLRGPRPLISGPVLTAAGTSAGVGFTVSLLISSLAFSGRLLSEAKLAALTTIVIAPLLTAIALTVVKRLPEGVRARQIGRTAEDIADLVEEVDPSRDHIRGPEDAPVTLLEYGDFECPYCGRAEEVIRQLLRETGSDVRYVWRHLPLNDVHPWAQLAAEASEAAAAQGDFWEMHDTLLAHQGELEPRDLVRYADDLHLDSGRFRADLRDRVHADRVAADVTSADESGVSGTPTFFINGRRHYGGYDIDTLTQAVRSAKLRAASLATIHA